MSRGTEEENGRGAKGGWRIRWLALYGSGGSQLTAHSSGLVRFGLAVTGDRRSFVPRHPGDDLVGPSMDASQPFRFADAEGEPLPFSGLLAFVQPCVHGVKASVGFLSVPACDGRQIWSGFVPSGAPFAAVPASHAAQELKG